MRKLGRIVLALLNELAKCALALLLGFALGTIHFHHGLVDGRVVRALHVRLPGYVAYRDFSYDEFPVRHRWSWVARYRVSPWMILDQS